MIQADIQILIDKPVTAPIDLILLSLSLSLSKSHIADSASLSQFCIHSLLLLTILPWQSASHRFLLTMYHLLPALRPF